MLGGLASTSPAEASYAQCPGSRSGYMCVWSDQSYLGNFGQFQYDNPTTWNSIAPGLYHNDDSSTNHTAYGNVACIVENYGTGTYNYTVWLDPGQNASNHGSTTDDRGEGNTFEAPAFGC